ncbi:secretin N-terminal domain-containing protein, partial [Paraburkholderia sp. RL17-373-BIF-A]|uniref:secretin N-terminal domain-containing protein n=1 Tax=Paraburkholderia sp. RL17-373-BIF-A TaxID=3031629 RepID=UPI0038BBE49C
MRLFLLVAGFLIACSTTAQPVTWRGPPFFLSSHGTTVASVLRSIGANYKLPVVVSAKITEPYVGELHDNPPGSALAELARLYQLLPYYDGSTLYVYKATEVDRVTLIPNYLGVGEQYGLVESSGLLDDASCQLRTMSHFNALQVNGVPVCLARVSALAKQLDEQKLYQEQDKETISLFPLKYANAADTSYTYRNQPVVVPGVVSVLREMAQGKTLSPSDGKSAATAGATGLPAFSADMRQNAVLVRDRKKNMGLYVDLIPKLDQ